jgi:hypothetical protein
MSKFFKFIAVTGLVSGIALSASAESHGGNLAKITCAEFTAMDADGQMEAMDAMHTMVDEMATDEMASDDATDDAMASDDATDDAMASDQMMAMTTACESAPDMMAMDAMMEMDAMASN